MSILHIENLSNFSTSNLTSLKLQVNRIDKICNLESLKNLIELDLSHNYICRIENLQTLTKLQNLVLNHNPISCIENLDAQKKSMEMLDISYCNISNLKYILYLNQFKNLVSIVVEGNPIRFEPTGADRQITICMIQSLRVYNKKMVLANERLKAYKDLSKLHELTVKNDKKMKHQIEEERKGVMNKMWQKESFIDDLLDGDVINLNDTVFENDTVKKLLSKNSHFGIQKSYRTFSDKFKCQVDDIIEAAEKNRHIRVGLLQKFYNELEELTQDRINKSRRNVLKFMEEKKNYLENYHSKEFDSKSNKYIDSRLKKLWVVLMSQEDGLTREINTMIEDLHDLLEKEIDQFKHVIYDRFYSLQTQLNMFLQFILESLSSFELDDPNKRFSKVSNMTNDISSFMEHQFLLINYTESCIMKKASEWLSTIFYNLKRTENRRNRQKLYEIATFVQFQSTKNNNQINSKNN
ncbi:dynein regulatory complex subunit 3-like isoform X3 [Daktulosphaira vitifoliae]|nr:dynein regulatory complex subunit 3-like isoform X2 [Daktulosphaira vitifoliae]XP_050530033.1 dynein regulatory complex subunit 3-like isoform X2 [Daktulosphaira vitifoliae]XP_050530034.1 dynein regulatory complex subunit 3-like isoform X3 [Daktulosphaira vitifoliae]